MYLVSEQDTSDKKSLCSIDGYLRIASRLTSHFLERGGYSSATLKILRIKLSYAAKWSLTGDVCAREGRMPFTPYHFGPSGFVGLAFRKWIDVPVFLLANVVIDFEPGIVLLFGLDYPAHGLCHTFLFGTAIGLAWGLLAYRIRGLLGWLMRLFALSYQTSLAKMVFSGVVGIWFHIFLDSFCWCDVRPFWPLRTNPFRDLMSIKTVYLLCTISFVPAIGLYVYAVLSGHRKRERMRNTRTLS